MATILELLGWGGTQSQEPLKAKEEGKKGQEGRGRERWGRREAKDVAAVLWSWGNEHEDKTQCAEDEWRQ